MACDWDFRIRFWGTRGTFTTPLPPEEIGDRIASSIQLLLQSAAADRLHPGISLNELREVVEAYVPWHVRSTYGGNTTCIEVRTPEQLFIIDAGSGLCGLGDELANRWGDAQQRSERSAILLLSHSHMDHVFAIPFVDPLYDGRNQFQIWAQKEVVDSLNAVLGPAAPLGSLYVPPTFAMMKGIKGFRQIKGDAEYSVGGTTVRTMSLNHPGECLAFRFERGSKSVVFASDHEQTQRVDSKLAEFVSAADVLYADAQYSEAEYKGASGVGGSRPLPRKGWGHSAVEYVVETAASANVQRLYLGHHDPRRSDLALAELEQLAERHLRGIGGSEMSVQAAREGTVVEL